MPRTRSAARIRRISVSVVLTAVVAGGMLGINVAFAAAPLFAPTVQVAAPSNAASAADAVVNGVSCESAGSCTAVGGYTDSSSYSQPMASSSTSGSFPAFSAVAPPSPATTNPNATLFAVSCWAVGSCVAVGNYTESVGRAQAMAATSSGGAFGAAVKVLAPANAGTDPGSTPQAVSCPSAGACTLAGSYYDGSLHERAMISNSSGGVFPAATEVAPPSDANVTPSIALDGVSCWSPASCTVAGGYDDNGGHLEAFVSTETNGVVGAATKLLPPSNAYFNPGSYLNGISCASAGNCTVVGRYSDTAPATQSMVATETNGVFGSLAELTPPPDALVGTSAGTEVTGVSCASAGDCLITGSYYDTASHVQPFYALESNGVVGAAVKLAAPSNAAANPNGSFNGASCVTATQCTLAGSYTTGSTPEPMVASGVAPLALTTTGAPSGVVGQAYATTLSSSGGVGKYTYSIASGQLPSGLGLNGATGAISGTPTAAGSATVTFQVVDAGPPSQQASSTLTIAIAAAPVTTTTIVQSAAPAKPKVQVTSKSLVLAGKPAKVLLRLKCQVTTCSGTAQLLQVLVTHRIVRVKIGSKVVAKTVSTTTKILLASATYHFAKGKAATVALALTPSGQRILVAAAKTPVHATASVSVKGGTTATKQVVVS